jgi:hypothetical protein
MPVLVHRMLPTTQDEIVVTGAAVDPEPDNAGVFQPVDDLYHAALPNDDMAERSPVTG